MRAATSAPREPRTSIENAHSAGRPAVLQPPLPRAPLQLVAQYQKRAIAEYLPLTDATSLMLTSKDMHRAIHGDPVMRLNEVAPAFERLGCNALLGRIQSAHAEISRVRPNGGQPAAPAGPSQWFKLARARAAPVFQGKERARQSEAENHLNELEAHKAQLTLQLQAMEPGVEGVIFHFAAGRTKGPRPPSDSHRAAPPTVPIRMRYGRLHKAIEDGEVETVRVGLREFLSLPPALMPNARKVAWLREPGGMCTLEIVGRRCCGSLQEPEQRCLEAVTAYIDEVVSSSCLLPSEKMQLCVKLDLTTPDPHSGAMNVVQLDIVRHAMRCSNPAVAAAILLGIHNSGADAAVKQILLSEIGSSWDGGLETCIDCVSTSLLRYAHRAPVWVHGMVAALESVK